MKISKNYNTYIKFTQAFVYALPKWSNFLIILYTTYKMN